MGTSMGGPGLLTRSVHIVRFSVPTYLVYTSDFSS